MTFPNTYKILPNKNFEIGKYSIVPIRYEDRFNIKKWRNEQIYHLRQEKPLTEEDQENYFRNIVAKLFEEEQPNQILFSYLRNGECIGYGGLVHINWTDKNAELSFIMDTELEKDEFEKHWENFICLIEKVAFQELGLHKIFTYAFDLRPHLYKAIEKNGFPKEAVLKEHCFFEEKFIDVVIHSKINDGISIRKLKNSDKEITFEWTNDKTTRESSFNSQEITFEGHSEWMERKLKNPDLKYYIAELDEEPASIIRFDKDEEKTIIGINVAPHFRGKKLAPKFLNKACKQYLSEKEGEIIFAYIKKENTASVKSFENAGFTFNKEVLINNIEAFEYQYARK